MRNFKLIEGLLPKLLANDDGVSRMRQLREAALKDEEGVQLATLLQGWNWSDAAVAAH